MRITASILAFICFLLPVLHAGVLDPNAHFQKANKHLLEFEKPEIADSLYQELIDDDFFSPDVFANQGNARFRLNQPGEAALLYRRALLMEPGHGEASQNLRFLNGRFGFLSFAEDTSQALAGLMSKRGWLRILTFSIWAIVLIPLSLIVLKPRSPMLRVFLIFVLLGALISGLTTGVGYYYKTRVWDGSNRVIVVRPNALAYTAPLTSASQVINLPRGSELRPLAKRESWVYVEIPGELRGWVERSLLEPLWPFDPSVLP